MHIAICDDELRELLHLQALLQKYDARIDISLFQSAENMFEGIKKLPCDLVFLDIEMQGLNGFDAAKRLRGMTNPPLILFVTNSGEYTYRGYEVEAFRYLPKPVSYDILSENLSAAIAKLSPHKFTITSEGRSYVVPVNEILYFEVFNHKVVIHTKKSDFECRMKLSEVEKSLPRNIFAKPHKSFLVNLDFIDTVEENVLSIIGNIQIPISRRRKQEFEQSLFRFVRR